MLDTVFELALDAVTETVEAVLTKKIRNKKAAADKTTEKTGRKPQTCPKSSIGGEEPENTGNAK